MYLNKEEGERRFIEAHRSWCEVLTEEAQGRLARTLTEAERQAIRDLKSFLFLEMFERDLFATQTREEAEQWLVNLIKTSRERVEREKALSGGLLSPLESSQQTSTGTLPMEISRCLLSSLCVIAAKSPPGK